MVEKFPSSIHNEFNILETDVETFEPFCLLLACLFESHTHCELVFDKTIFVKEMFCKRNFL